MLSNIRYTIYSDFNLYVAISVSEISFEDIFKHVEILMRDPQYYVGINAIYDFTGVTLLSGDISAFEQLANDMSDNTVIPKTACTAMLIRKNQQVVKAMMEGYLLMTSGSNIDFQIFNEEEVNQAKRHVALPLDMDLSLVGITI